MRLRRRALLATLLAGCGYSYTQTGATSVPARPLNCTFEVLTLPPDRPFDELGLIEWIGSYAPRSVNQLEDEARKHVCAAGGDAVVAIMPAGHAYTRATVIRYRAPQP